MERKIDPHDLLVALLQTNTAIERLSDAFFQPYGLTSAQFNILNLLSLHEGRMEQLALVGELLVGKASVSIVINRMVRSGFLRREGHPRDRRQVILILTAKGRRLWRKIAPTYAAGVQEIFGTVAPSRRASFLHELNQLQEALTRRLADL
jgi:DNA-binding MarR family transcriptional regulator